MYGNGVGTGRALIPLLPRPIRAVLIRAPAGCCAVVPGATAPPACVAPIAASAAPAAGATTLVSASPGQAISSSPSYLFTIVAVCNRDSTTPIGVASRLRHQSFFPIYSLYPPLYIQ